MKYVVLYSDWKLRAVGFKIYLQISCKIHLKYSDTNKRSVTKLNRSQMYLQNSDVKVTDRRQFCKSSTFFQHSLKSWDPVQLFYWRVSDNASPVVTIIEYLCIHKEKQRESLVCSHFFHLSLSQTLFSTADHGMGRRYGRQRFVDTFISMYLTCDCVCDHLSVRVHLSAFLFICLLMSLIFLFPPYVPFSIPPSLLPHSFSFS